MDEREIEDWNIQTIILKAYGYTSDEINNRSFYERHNIIRNNCEGYEIGDFYNPDRNKDEHDW
ncbi:MAG: hypothetical protein M0Q13_02580 [Methanothrix sp.]|jgi:hypothetical protein|nr:hypothetical protein [Methanothrix sp.]